MFQQIREIIVKTIVILFVCVFMCSISYCGYFGGAGGGVDIPTGDGEWFRLDATNGPLTGKTIIDHNDGGAAGHQLQLTSATSDEVAMVFFDDADTDDAWFYGMESTGQGTISWWNNSNFPVSPNNFVLRMELDAAGTLRLNSTTQPQIEFQSFVSGSPANATGSTRAKLYFRNPNRLHSRDNVGGENKYSIDTEVMLLDGTNAMTGALDHGHNASDNLTQSTYEDSATPTVRATISAADHGFNEGLLFNFDQVGEVNHALRLQHSTAGYLQLEMVNNSGQELNIGWVHDQDAWAWYHSGLAKPAYFSVTGSALATAGIILQIDDTVDIRGLTLANAMDANGKTISNASSLELDDGGAGPFTIAQDAFDYLNFVSTGGGGYLFKSGAAEILRIELAAGSSQLTILDATDSMFAVANQTSIGSPTYAGTVGIYPEGDRWKQKTFAGVVDTFAHQDEVMLLDGSQAMTGALDAGNQNIINAASVRSQTATNLDMYWGTALQLRHQEKLVRMLVGFRHDQAVVSLTADNQVVDVWGKGVHKISSDSVTATDRTFTLTGNQNGSEITLLWEGANAGELLDTGNACLSADWTPDANDSLRLIYTNTAACWVEISRSAN